MTQPRNRIVAGTMKKDRKSIWWGLGVLGIAISLCAANVAKAADDDLIVSHGYSFYGDLKYDKDFTQFDYVNPDAPKGGEYSTAYIGTFDSMNPYTRKGNARGTLSWTTYESLLESTADSVDDGYCLLCTHLEYPKDKSWVIFHMRKDAKFSDGSPVTAHDVLFSHNLLLDDGLKSYADAVRARIPNAEALDDHTIKFYFADDISRRSLIDQVGGVPVWSKKWYEETGARLNEARIDVSPGSGPYVIKEVVPGRRVVYERNPDYWGKDLPNNVGRHNFDRVRVEYFTDDTAAFEAFKAGEVSVKIEGDPKKWATSYNFPKVEDGHVVKKVIPDGLPPNTIGIIFNLRKPVMKNAGLREALALAYNFEWTNESLQYGLFKHLSSFSQDTPIMAQGVPQGAELEFLKSLGDVVPQDIYDVETRVSHTSNASRLNDRRNLRKAMKFLDEAGFAVGDDGIRTNPDGSPLELAFLFNASSSPTTRSVVENYVANAKTMGLNVKLDVVDASQYELRERDFDYDLVFDNYRFLLGVGTGLAQRYGSEAAGFSLFNPAGIASPLVDAVIERSLLAESKEEEQASLMALDRALRNEFAMIPTWYKADHWIAHYNMYEHPDEIPPYALGSRDFWWHNSEGEARLRAAGALR